MGGGNYNSGPVFHKTDDLAKWHVLGRLGAYITSVVYGVSCTAFLLSIHFPFLI